MFLLKRRHSAKPLSYCARKVVFHLHQGVDYIGATAAYGTDAVREIQKVSKDFAEVNGLNARTITKVFLRIPGAATRDIAAELFSRGSTLQRLIGTAILMRFGIITEPDAAFGSAEYSEEPGVITMMERALQQLDRETVDRFLMGVLTQRPCDHRRCCLACSFLKERNPTGFVPTLAECLKDPEFPSVASAFYALHSLGYKEARRLALERFDKGIPEAEAEWLTQPES